MAKQKRGIQNELLLLAKWLVGVSIYLIVFGVLLAFFSQSQFMHVLLNQYIDPSFWPDNQVSAGTMQYKKWVSGVLGAVVLAGEF